MNLQLEIAAGQMIALLDANVGLENVDQTTVVFFPLVYFFY